MSRITYKLERPETMQDYGIYCAHNYHAINKLGKLEDLMEKYSIPDIEYLEKCIQDHDKYGETSEKLDVDLAEFVSELVYVLNHSNQTTGYTSKGKEITTDYGYVESFIEDLKKAIKNNGEQ